MDAKEQERKAAAKILEKTGLSKTELEKKIKAKVDEFSGLVSRTGAIYIIGKELGINLVKTKKNNLKIANIVSEMSAICFRAKIISQSDIKEFNKNGRSGKVKNIVLADDSGTIRMSLWNDDIDKTKEMKTDEIYDFINCYTKKNIYNDAETRLGRKGAFKIVEDADFKTIENIPTTGKSKKTQKQSLENIEEGDSVETTVTITRIFDRDILYYTCPECKKRLGSNSECAKHGKVKKEYLLVLNAVAEDNYDETNIIFFRDNAEKVIGKDTKKIEKEIQKENTNTFLEKSSILGTEFKIKGYIKKNSFTKTLELHTEGVERIDIIADIKDNLKRLEKNKQI